MASIVIGHSQFQRMLRPYGAELHQEFADVLYLFGEGLASFAVMQQVTVIFEHRPAAGDVNDDGIERFPFFGLKTKSSHVLFRKVHSGFFLAGVVMQSAATTLAP